MKESKPIDTIKKCRECLEKIDVFVIEKWIEPLNGIYSVQLCVEHTGIFSNGKSTSREFALASAYGELLERIQNLAYFRFNNCHELYYRDLDYVIDNKEKYSNTFYEYNEQKLWLKACGISNLPNETEWQKCAKKNKDGQIVNIVFNPTDKGEKIMVPLSVLEYYYGSNGMAAGNTLREAFLQGLCEILERYVIKEVIKKKIKVPDITEYAKKNYSFIQDAISQLEKMNLRLYVKDLSIIDDIPACACVVMDDKFNYFCAFGVHPIEELAIERTLTELCQGKDFSDFNFWTSAVENEPLDIKIVKNMTSIQVGNGGVFPISFFGGECKEEMKAFAKYADGNIDIWISQILRYFDDRNKKVYYRNTSILGFDSCQIIVPGYSELRDMDEYDYLERSFKNQKILKYFRNIKKIDKKEANEIIAFLISCNKRDTSFADFINIPLKNRIQYRVISVNVLLAMLYIYIKDFENARIFLREYIHELNYTDDEIVNYYKAICIALQYYKECSKEQISSLIKVLNPSINEEDIFNVIDYTDTVFSEIPVFECLDCRDCNVECYGLYEKELYKRIQNISNNISINNLLS